MARTKKTKKGGGKRSGAPAQPVLGISVTLRAIHAVLVQAKGDRLRVIRQFTRQRSAEVESAVGAKSVSAASGVPLESGDDISFDFMQEGGSADMSNLFLQSEFDSVGVDEPDAVDGEPEPRQNTAESPTTFVLELQDLLSECRDIGYDGPAVAFCVGAPDVNYVELHKPKPPKGRKKSKKNSEEIPAEPVAVPEDAEDRATLIAWLKVAYDQPFDVERVEFIPMAPDDTGARFLALVPDESESVASTVDLFQLQSGAGTPATRLIDTEVSLYLGLARSSFPLAEDENTAIVRVGSDDTLVLFLKGEQLLQQKTLHSLTTFDPPETICSRILLQQDELGIGTLHNVLVIGEEKDDDLITGLIMFYPDSKVASIRDGLASFALEMARPEDGELQGAMVPAVGAALRVITGRNARESLFEDVNLLPKRLQKNIMRVSLAWHTIASGVLLFFVVLFFVGSFYNQQKQIAETRQRIAAYPSQLEMTEAQLRHRIDSLQTAYQNYTRALGVLDSLLVGSDRWTRMMEKISRDAASVTGVWVDTWQPRDTEIRIQGNATSRDRIVQFAERLNGSIEILTFSEIREWPVYHYSMVVPMPRRMPEAARYLREQAITELD